MAGQFGANMDVREGGTPGRTKHTHLICACPLMEGGLCGTVMEM